MVELLFERLQILNEKARSEVAVVPVLSNGEGKSDSGQKRLVFNSFGP
jgi:hypothetical protein